MCGLWTQQLNPMNGESLIQKERALLHACRHHSNSVFARILAWTLPKFRLYEHFAETEHVG